MKPFFETDYSLKNDRNIWLIVSSILTAGLMTADSAILDYDGFNHAPGDLPNFNPGATPFFAGGWDANAAWGGVPGTVLQVQAGSASYPGHGSSGGSLAVGSQTFSDAWAGSNSVANRASREFATHWDSTTEGTYYISFLMGFGQDTIDSVGYRAFEMWSESVDDAPGRSLQLGYSAYGDFGSDGISMMNLHITPNGANTPGDPAAVDTLLPVTGSLAFGADGGATHLFVLRFDLSSIPGLDVIQLYLDPVDLVSEGGNAPNAIFVGDFAASHISAGSQFILPALTEDGAAGGPHDVAPQPANIGIFDELVVADGWGYFAQVPEPATFGLLGLGGLVFMAARRNKNKN